MTRRRGISEARILRWLAICVLVITSTCLGLYLSYLQLNDDAGYFLPLARHLLQGDLPYLDVFNWHTPWGPVFFTPIAALSPNVLIHIAPFYMLFWNLLSAILIAAFVMRYQQHVQLAMIAGCWFLLMAIIVGGYYVTLEPIYLPMMLMAWYLADADQAGKRSWLLAGILLGLALMVKQFAFMGMVAVLPLAFRRKFWPIFLAGYSIPVVLTILFFLVNGLAPIDLFQHWLVPPGLSPYLNSDIQWMGFLIISLPILLRIAAGGLFSPKGSFVQLVGAMFFLAIWFIGANMHYLLLTAGWIAPLLFEIKSQPLRFLLASFITAVLLSLLVVFSTVKGKNKRLQIEQATFLSSEISIKDRLVIPGTSHQYLYALTKAQPPFILEAGYQIFPFAPENLKQAIFDSATVVLGVDFEIKKWDKTIEKGDNGKKLPGSGLSLHRMGSRK